MNGNTIKMARRPVEGHPQLRPRPQTRVAEARPTQSRSTPSTRMRTLSKQSHAVSGEEREARRVRVLDYLQMVRIATRRDIDRVAGYAPGTSHDYTLEWLYKRRLIDRIENVESGQSLYSITERGEAYASAPTELTPLSTIEWQASAQQEHRLGVAALTSVLLSPTPLEGALWQGDDKIREALLSGDWVLLGEPLINAAYARRYGKRRMPEGGSARLLEEGPSDVGLDVGRVQMYEDSWWYAIPPYLWDTGSRRELPLSVLYPEGADTPQSPGPGVRVMERHPADAVLAPRTMQPHDAIALEVERYCKSTSDYISTMARYGSELGRARFRRVIWAYAAPTRY